MKIGISAFCTDQTLPPDALARAVEERSFESLFLTDHSHIPTSRATDYPGVYGGGELPDFYKRNYDVFVALAYAASATSVLKLGTGICLIVQRDPIITAKEVASLDVLSGGRLAALGVGFGWNREEMEDHGTDFRTRRELARDRIGVMRALWRDEVGSFKGEYANLEPSWAWPKPTRMPPVHLGGDGPKAMRAAAEWADGWFPVCRQDDPTMEKTFAKFWAVVDEIGRDRSTIALAVTSAPAEPRILEALREQGVERVTFQLTGEKPDAALRLLDQYAAVAADFL